MKSPLRLMIACGGTGGHLFPGIAVAQAARTRGWETLLLISEKEIDTLATKAHSDLRFEKVPAIAMPSPLSLAFLKFLSKFWQTRTHCKKLLTQFKADAVLGMGGFTSLPPVMAGRSMKLKTFIHESNAIPGKANKFTSKFCDHVLLGLAACAPYFPKAKVSVTGTPLRSSLHRPLDEDEVRAFFQLPEGRQTILIMGGSQGARGVNRAVIESLPLFASVSDYIQLLHITGPGEYDMVRREYSEYPHIVSHVAPFCQHMEMAYAVSDVAVSRSGASSLTELSAFGIPTILVPYPTSADDHQRRNADVFTSTHAALAAEEATLTEGVLGRMIVELLNDPDQCAGLAENMQRLAPSDAADKVCDVIAAAVGVGR